MAVRANPLAPSLSRDHRRSTTGHRSLRTCFPLIATETSIFKEKMKLHHTLILNGVKIIQKVVIPSNGWFSWCS
ncbi:hypothetical protein NDU88_000351 [Pleurodeles waltl]|uniref:Uncharacterized protein n=1 Tax=Pleurodeles waltl TaxID=8319 RepID=A0AAV7SWE6_PLEWA|nr:hypothetical protein NDU88_000351 [Pleurodeles waltl]